MGQGFGEINCFCGRKKKYGFNMQATCYYMERFLDVEIAFPSATSDFFAFLNVQIKKKLEVDEFLDSGLALFGTMLTPTHPKWLLLFGMSFLVLRSIEFFHS